MAQDDTLPRGLWYEAPKRRYRVRRYHNGVAYLKGYYRTYPEAERALQELNEYLDTIPKERKAREMPSAADRSLSGHAKSVRGRQERTDPIRS